MRFLRDRFSPDEKNGDVVVSWDLEETRCTNRRACFYPPGIPCSVSCRGPEHRETFVLDYSTGNIGDGASKGIFFTFWDVLAGLGSSVSKIPNRVAQAAANLDNLLLPETVEKWQRQCSVGHLFGDGEIVVRIRIRSEQRSANVGEQNNARNRFPATKSIPARSRLDQPGKPGGKTDHVNKPTQTAVLDAVGGRVTSGMVSSSFEYLMATASRRPACAEACSSGPTPARS